MLASFRETYDVAVEYKLDQFPFNGAQFVTSYARYLIEFLDGHFRE